MTVNKGYLTRRPSSMLADPFFRGLLGDESFGPLDLLGRWNESLGQNQWLPAVDVRETDSAYVFTAELPGMSKDDVRITLENKVLTIAGERKFDSEEKKNDYHRIERSYGAFSRSFSLPGEVDQDSVKAKFKDGLLSVEIAKAEEVKPRRIEIS